MKNFKILLLAIVAMLTLTSCGQQEPADFSALAEVLTDRKYQLISQDNTSFTGNGLIHNDLTRTYYYLDYETMTEIPLCPDPNCEHGAYYEKHHLTNDSCGAYYYNHGFYYNGKMYYTDRKWQTRGIVDIDYFLCSADLDGQNRKTLAVFEDYDYIQHMYRYENILYIFLYKPIWGDSDRTDNIVPKDIHLCVFDLSTETLLLEETIFEGSDEKTGNPGFLGFDQEGYVYYKVFSYTEFDGPNTDEGSWRCKVENGVPKIEDTVKFDEVSGDWRVLYDYQEDELFAQCRDLSFRINGVGGSTWFIHENRLYFWDYQRPDLYYLDSETGTVYLAENCLEQMVAGIHQCLCDVYDDFFIFSEAVGGSIFAKRSMSEFDFHEYEGEYECTYA